MKVLVIGGSGLLGTHTVREAVKRGHAASVLSRGTDRGTPASAGDPEWIKGDVHAMSAEELRVALAGQDAVVYSLGLDDRIPHAIPAYRAFHRDHVAVCMKVLQAARAAGVRKFVVFGSYFTDLDRRFPLLELADRHIYVRTRKEQRDAVLAANAPGFGTFVLEIPYVIGALPGKVPPWSFLFDMLAGEGRSAWFFLRGGTAAVTPFQIGQAALGAIEGGQGGLAYPLGGINLDWADLARRFLAIRGTPKRLKGLPRSLFVLFGWLSALFLAIQGKERGLAIGRFAELQYMPAFIDPEPSMAALGYRHDDYDAALTGMVREWDISRRKPGSTAAKESPPLLDETLS